MLTIQSTINNTQGTEHEALKQIEDRLGFYTGRFQDHLLHGLIEQGKFPDRLTAEFAELQYIDSVFWVPMLALMKDHARNPKLRQVLTENLLCEAGARHTSHVTLCMQFVESIGVPALLGRHSESSIYAEHPTEIMSAIHRITEGEIAGWMYAAESLVPHLFTLFRPAVAAIHGAELRYIDEHLQVDTDDHAHALLEAIKSLLAAGTSLSEVLSGMDLGARVALSVPDALYAKALRQRSSTLRRVS